MLYKILQEADISKYKNLSAEMIHKNIVGYQMWHSYRAKDANGHKRHFHRIFYFDISLSTVLKTELVENNEDIPKYEDTKPVKDDS